MSLQYPNDTEPIVNTELHLDTNDEDMMDNDDVQPTEKSLLHASLLKGKGNKKDNRSSTGRNHDIRHAPLLSGDTIDTYTSVTDSAGEVIRQYGLLGCRNEGDPTLPLSQIFMNTSAPFSTFVCGVQGSGKSHTTACIIENSVISSPALGKLNKPLSTIVFSYGEWSNGGRGFNVSEAISLDNAAEKSSECKAKKIIVLVSPTNPAIKHKYERENVQVIPFKLKASTLDISALRALMAVDDKSAVPLYMARVEQILRDIASTSEDGALDYDLFKTSMDGVELDNLQRNMLNLRLNLLETFLDFGKKVPEPSYTEGEIVIMDLSDQFITPSTACVLFKLGLDQFLNCSDADGKLVVLDEAHKYMLDNPGSKFFTGLLDRTVREQRHKGSRLLISTQEPTISTVLIGLCAVVVMHRFTSPSWYHALKQDIHAVRNDDDVIKEIGGLSTGEAFVYAPTAVLGTIGDGTLCKPTGKLVKVNMKDRVTADIGRSKMAA